MSHTVRNPATSKDEHFDSSGTGVASDPFIPSTGIRWSDDALFDSFNRLRISQARTTLDAQHHYGQTHELFTGMAGAAITSISIGANALVTMPSAHGLVAGNIVRFVNRGGALPGGITQGRVYFVIATGLTTTAFEFSETEGGPAVTTTGSNTGTTSVLSQELICTEAGTLVDSTVDSSLILNVTSTPGSIYINRSQRQYYISGQSHLSEATFNMGTFVPGIRTSVGYNDFDDGLRFERDATTGELSIIIRSSTSGSVDDSRVFKQSEWNVDRLDGSKASGGTLNPSGITVDWTKVQLVGIDLQWFGVGRIRWFISYQGAPILIHETSHTNVNDVVYMQNPHLPISYEIENVSAASSATFKQICAASFTEGMEPASIYKHTVNNDSTTVALVSTAYRNVISIRPRQFFRNKQNKGMIVPLTITLNNTGLNALIFKVIADGTVVGTYTPHNTTESIMEVCIGTAGTYTAGTGIAKDSDYVNSSSPLSGIGVGIFDQRYRLQIDAAGYPDSITIVAKSISGSTSVLAKLTVEELR